MLKRLEEAWNAFLNALGIPESYPVLNCEGQGRVPIQPLRQTRTSSCGLVSAKVVLNAFGVLISDGDLAEKLRLSERWGVSTTAMKTTLRDLGFRVGSVRKPTWNKTRLELERGALILTTVRRGRGLQHWVVVFAARSDRRVAISGDRAFSTHSEPWNNFKRRIGDDFLIIAKR